MNSATDTMPNVQPFLREPLMTVAPYSKNPS